MSMWIGSLGGEEGRQNILRWIETFPDRFAGEAQALREQFLGLPWEQWIWAH
ncbi:hypothetical protein PQX77_009495 [Marasmius sp. AFHP31]|nr:hypothetical protein PQX77_009495 [Marasmius sp. AFHP31]